jgi:glucose-6-phosphate isomerase, archaeal
VNPSDSIQSPWFDGLIQRRDPAEPSVMIRPQDAALLGQSIAGFERSIGELGGLFADETARAKLPQDRRVYQVQTHGAANENTSGGLMFGVTLIEAGRVGDEYFMTRGHFHARSEAAEYYWGICGEGILLLMDRRRRWRAERMRPGSLHYIPGHVAHRVANVGTGPLTFGACWPADAGHDYASIERDGFAARIVCVEGEPRVMAQDGA